MKLGLYPRPQKECKVSWKARALGKPPRLLHLSSEGAEVLVGERRPVAQPQAPPALLSIP